jgi:23S rRNA pseudouridine1911/1915/1917 synthase
MSEVFRNKRPLAAVERYGPWPPPPFRADRVKLTSPEELRSWIVHEDENLLVVNKSGEVVCHPSKFGPTSSLVGAAREYCGLVTVHLIFRLDRETSGVVVMAKNAETASRLQTAVQKRRVAKTYLAFLVGQLAEAVTVDQPLGADEQSPVWVKDTVRADGKPAVSHFTPIADSGKFTVARVTIETGRKHQIRAHAQWLGHSVVGDKIYGPDDRHYLSFIETGWTDELAQALLMRRQALHCTEIDLRPAGVPMVFRAPLPPDMVEFARHAIPTAPLALTELLPE